MADETKPWYLDYEKIMKLVGQIVIILGLIATFIQSTRSQNNASDANVVAQSALAQTQANGIQVAAVHTDVKEVKKMEASKQP